MKNANSPASPIEINGFGQYAPAWYTGLTKRELFAMHAMSSWISHNGASRDFGFNSKEAASSAIEFADALLKELEK